MEIIRPPMCGFDPKSESVFDLQASSRPSSPSTLVILPNNLGDVIMATPVLEGLRFAAADGTVAFLVEQGFDGGVVNNPHCSEIICIPRREIRDLLWSDTWEVGLRRLRDMMRGLSDRGFSQLINLCQHEYIAFLVALIEVPLKVGRRFLAEGNHAIFDDWSQYLYAIPFERRFNNLHAVDVYRRIVGVQQHRGGYTIRLTEEEQCAAAEFLRSRLGRCLDRRRTVVFQPGAAYPSKRWPVEHFVALGTMLQESGWTIVITGAPAEIELARAVAEPLGSCCVITAGQTTFRQSIAVVAQAACCVTGDTALMHAAAGLDVPVYALFGPTNPVETGPYGNSHWIFAGRCAQRPCFRFKCENLACMKTILPQTVFACIEKDSADLTVSCDIYRTRLEANGDYTLTPLRGEKLAYVDGEGAAMTRYAFGDDRCEIEIDRQGGDENVRETLRVLDYIKRMRRRLSSFLTSRRAEDIKHFERLKTELQSDSGISAFWAALLNIRLNSVPMLDPMEAVRHSITVCIHTEKQLRRALREA